MSGSVTEMLQKRADNEKVLLTSWLIKQRKLGNQVPRINSNTLDEINQHRKLSILDRVDNLLCYIVQSSDRIGEKIPRQSLELTAWTASVDVRETNFLIKHCIEKALIASDGENISITIDGLSRVEDLENSATDNSLCFVAMWFSTEMDEPYNKGIYPAVEKCGYTAQRIDKKEHIDKIDDAIIAEIRRSRFIIADFTSEPDKPRGGVYYEAGFAQGLNIPVIWTCRSDCIESVHFDTRQFNHIVWDAPQDLYEKLTARIGAVIGDGPLRR